MKKATRCLVVDDDPISHFLCGHTLRKVFKKGEIKLFEEPKEALEFIKHETADTDEIFTILFLDINMPSMTGWDFLDQYKNLGEDIHKRFIVYILSSSSDYADKVKAESNPLVSGFFCKPLTKDHIHQFFFD